MVKKQLTTEAQQWLIRKVTTEEIKEALFQMNSDKVLGPDGFNAGFFQKNWDIVATDTCTTVIIFFPIQQITKGGKSHLCDFNSENY